VCLDRPQVLIEVSAMSMAMTGLDDYDYDCISGARRSGSTKGSHGGIAVFLFIYPLHSQLFLQAQVHSLQSKRLSCSSLTIFS
jgi:hypothetical protein